MSSGEPSSSDDMAGADGRTVRLELKDGGKNGSSKK